MIIYGLILVLVILALYGVIVVRSLARLMEERDPFARLAGAGLAWLGALARQELRIGNKPGWEKGLAGLGIVGLLTLGWLAFDRSPMVSLVELRVSGMSGEQQAAEFLKTVVQETVPWVRIPPSPPIIVTSCIYYINTPGRQACGTRQWPKHGAPDRLHILSSHQVTRHGLWPIRIVVADRVSAAAVA